MSCYRNGGCGPYEMCSCTECPASKPEYLKRGFSKADTVRLKAINIQWDTDGETVILPSEITIPSGMIDEDEISDYLSDQTGFCHTGFCLEFI